MTHDTQRNGHDLGCFDTGFPWKTVLGIVVFALTVFFFFS